MENRSNQFHRLVDELLKEYDNVCTLRVRMAISSDLNQNQINLRGTSESKGIRVYNFNLDYVARIKRVVELPFNALLLSNTRAKGNKSSSASKVNSAPAGKLKSVKIKDDPPLAICDIRKPIWYLDSGCSRHMTGVKIFTNVAFDNGLKYNLISISQLCDAKYIVQFDEKRGTIFNSNKEIVMISPRVKDAYVFDMTSSAQESCFFAKASKNLN
ncbi:hypothetical protein Tco_0709380 [Tanacetum coccineum]